MILDMNEQKIIKQAEDRITANAYIHYASDLIYKKPLSLDCLKV